MALLPDIVEPYREDRGHICYCTGQAYVSAYEVMHISGMTFDGLVGLSLSEDITSLSSSVQAYPE